MSDGIGKRTQRRRSPVQELADRREAGGTLERIVESIDAGEIEAEDAQRAYIAGAAAGLGASRSRSSRSSR